MLSMEMGVGSAGPVEAWLSAARLGDNEALGQAIDSCREYLLLVADRELDHKFKPKGGASDIVQETFLDAQRDFGRFEGRTGPELMSWLHRILRNNLLSHVRRYMQSKRHVAREVRLGDGGGLTVAEACRGVRGESPSQHAMLREQAERLAEALDRLPERPRQAVVWRHQEHCSFEEIGLRLGISPDAARMTWSRAIRRLQGELEGLGGGSSRGGPGRGD